MSGLNTGKGESTRVYAGQMSYTAHGAVSSLQLGNAKWEHTGAIKSEI